MHTMKHKLFYIAAALLCLAGCAKKTVSNLKLSGDCLVQSISLDNFAGIVDLPTRTIVVRLPEVYATSEMTITELTLSKDATSNVAKGQVLNMDAPKGIHVTNGDASIDWTLSVLHDEARILHFVLNPDPMYPWWGRGLTCSIAEVANNIKQARATEKGFMESKWKPSVIVKVDAMIDEFSSPEGRQKLLESYVKSNDVGEPWLIPADQFQVDQIRPLSLADLAINDTVEIDKKTIAAMLGVPTFVLGVGDYNAEEWNNFINNTIRPIAKEIEQELTKKLILSPKWYLRFNIWSLMNWDIKTVASVFGQLRKQGVVTGNEVRDRVGMSPMDGLDELVMLENYIPVDKLGDQKKLIQEDDEL